MKKIQSRLSSQGQVILVVLLAAAVIMTLGLSAAKRTTTDTKIDTDEELLKQAFNTAESGVDYYLSTGSKDYSAPDGKSKATVSTNDIGGETFLASNEVVTSGNTFLFWLVGHDNDGNINIDDKYNAGSVNIKTDDAYNKALKIDYFYESAAGIYQVSRSGYNMGNSSTVDNFTAVSNNIISNFQTSGTPLLIAVTPINGSTNITIEGSANFPIQGEEITSVGQAGEVSATTGVNTQVKVVNRYKIPSFMLDAITAGGSVSVE